MYYHYTQSSICRNRYMQLKLYEQNCNLTTFTDTKKANKDGTALEEESDQKEVVSQPKR